MRVDGDILHIFNYEQLEAASISGYPKFYKNLPSLYFKATNVT